MDGSVIVLALLYGVFSKPALLISAILLALHDLGFDLNTEVTGWKIIPFGIAMLAIGMHGMRRLERREAEDRR